MDQARFEGVLDTQIERIRDVLGVKSAEYANEDVLATIRKVADLRRVGLPQALIGMMAKHTASIYDMVESGKPFTMEKWDEKITDHINYLILLRAALIDNANPEQGALSC